MPPPPHCNKCKVGFCQPGDSWCVGCSSLELGQSLLKQSWGHPGIRAAAEEAILSAARLVKAFSNLDRGLSRGAAEPGPGLTPKAKAQGPRSRKGRLCQGRRHRLGERPRCVGLHLGGLHAGNPLLVVVRSSLTRSRKKRRSQTFPHELQSPRR